MEVDTTWTEGHRAAFSARRIQSANEFQRTVESHFAWLDMFTSMATQKINASCVAAKQATPKRARSPLRDVNSPIRTPIKPIVATTPSRTVTAVPATGTPMRTVTPIALSPMRSVVDKENPMSASRTATPTATAAPSTTQMSEPATHLQKVKDIRKAISSLSVKQGYRSALQHSATSSSSLSEAAPSSSPAVAVAQTSNGPILAAPTVTSTTSSSSISAAAPPPTAIMAVVPSVSSPLRSVSTPKAAAPSPALASSAAASSPVVSRLGQTTASAVPARLLGPTSSPRASPGDSPRYRLIPDEHISDDDDETDDDLTPRKMATGAQAYANKLPSWAQPEKLEATMRRQDLTMDGEAIFGNIAKPDLTDILGPRRRRLIA